MELDIELLAQALVFLVSFTATVIILSGSGDGAERQWQSIMCVLRTLGKMISGRVEPPRETVRVEGRLSDETWQRLLYVHMTNAAPDRRIWFR